MDEPFGPAVFDHANAGCATTSAHRHGHPTAERHYARRLSQISHTYRGGPLTPPRARFRFRSGVTAAGDPSVPGLKRNDLPVCTLDLISSPAHTLLVFTGHPADTQTAQAAITRLARRDGVVDTVLVGGASEARRPNAAADPDLAAHRRYRAGRGQLLLVRPDGYLASRAPLNRPDIPERYLLQLTDASRGELATAARTTG